ncbi:deoxyguanosinetriphosphate triphosphohydrolase [Deinococcus sp.]|uniref:deoxyguanosinetriphosphate triphosphohydrolase n=1 Tax=Deinococcus sp. TaxID=47478 RepID=UPI003CC63406
MLLDRRALEAREAQTLAPYAALSGASLGRLYPEAESSTRTAFQKDRDRVLHTTAFRRLEYKTQVFLNAQGDHYRTRLTHTLEVAQVARSAALSLGLNETLAEVLSLAHDLGHPPFGHAGEAILNRLLDAHGGFDHNRQTLRIVTELEDRYPEFPGLNLTRETLAGLAKHSRPAGGQHSLEAQLVNVADGLAYSAHDLDDGLRSGLIVPYDLRGVALWEQLSARLKLRPDHLSDKDRRCLQRELLGLLIGDLTAHSHEQLSAAGVATPQDVAAQPGPLIAFSTELQASLNGLNHFLFERLYRHPRVLRQVAQAEHCLESLYHALLKAPGMLPRGFQARLEQDGPERTVCDYVAGMTDRYALDEYRHLQGVGGESGF